MSMTQLLSPGSSLDSVDPGAAGLAEDLALDDAFADALAGYIEFPVDFVPTRSTFMLTPNEPQIGLSRLGGLVSDLVEYTITYTGRGELNRMSLMRNRSPRDDHEYWIASAVFAKVFLEVTVPWGSSDVPIIDLLYETYKRFALRHSKDPDKARIDSKRKFTAKMSGLRFRTSGPMGLLTQHFGADENEVGRVFGAVTDYDLPLPNGPVGALTDLGFLDVFGRIEEPGRIKAAFEHPGGLPLQRIEIGTQDRSRSQSFLARKAENNKVVTTDPDGNHVDPDDPTVILDFSQGNVPEGYVVERQGQGFTDVPTAIVENFIRIMTFRHQAGVMERDLNARVAGTTGKGGRKPGADRVQRERQAILERRSQGSSWTSAWGGAQEILDRENDFAPTGRIGPVQVPSGRHTVLGPNGEEVDFAWWVPRLDDGNDFPPQAGIVNPPAALANDPSGAALVTTDEDEDGGEEEF